MRVDMNRGGLRKLRGSPGLRRPLDKAADAIGKRAGRNVPTKRRRHYARSWSTSSAALEGGEMVAKAQTSDSSWHLIEYGSLNNPAYAAARKAIEGAGMRFEDKG